MGRLVIGCRWIAWICHQQGNQNIGSFVIYWAQVLTQHGLPKDFTPGLMRFPSGTSLSLESPESSVDPESLTFVWRDRAGLYEGASRLGVPCFHFLRWYLVGSNDILTASYRLHAAPVVKAQAFWISMCSEYPGTFFFLGLQVIRLVVCMICHLCYIVSIII